MDAGGWIPCGAFHGKGDRLADVIDVISVHGYGGRVGATTVKNKSNASLRKRETRVNNEEFSSLVRLSDHGE